MARGGESLEAVRAMFARMTPEARKVARLGFLQGMLEEIQRIQFETAPAIDLEAIAEMADVLAERETIPALRSLLVRVQVTAAGAARGAPRQPAADAAAALVEATASFLVEAQLDAGVGDADDLDGQETTTTLSTDELVAAWRLVQAFWAALARDDGWAVYAMQYPASRARFAGEPAGRAELLRDLMHLSPADCDAMALSGTVRLLEDGSGGDAVAILGVRGQGRIHVLGADGPELVHSWVMVAYRRQHGDPWSVWGSLEDTVSDVWRGLEIVDISAHVVETSGPTN